jgi:hypothetical protein
LRSCQSLSYSRIFQHYMQPESSLPSSQDPSTDPYPEPDLFHWLYSPFGPWPLIFSPMIILQTVGLPGRVISSSQGLHLNTGQHKHRINTYTYQTAMPCVGFETTIPASERAKTVHALDQWFSTFVRPRHGNFFYKTRARYNC